MVIILQNLWNWHFFQWCQGHFHLLFGGNKCCTGSHMHSLLIAEPLCICLGIIGAVNLFLVSIIIMKTLDSYQFYYAAYWTAYVELLFSYWYFYTPSIFLATLLGRKDLLNPQSDVYLCHIDFLFHIDHDHGQKRSLSGWSLYLVLTCQTPIILEDLLSQICHEVMTMKSWYAEQPVMQPCMHFPQNPIRRCIQLQDM